MLLCPSDSREQEEAEEEDKENDAPTSNTTTNNSGPFLSMVDFLKQQQGATAPAALAPSDDDSGSSLAKPTPARATPGKIPALAAALAAAGEAGKPAADAVEGGDAMADDLRLVEVSVMGRWGGWTGSFVGRRCMYVCICMYTHAHE